jgi:4-amino-4-deoxy-L-arabinose transferase-like glycosyltransferase
VNLRRAALIGVFLSTTLIGIFDHDLWEPDEPRAAELGREFLDPGARASVPTLNGRPFLEKPPLVYWSIAASLKVFGVHDWAARLPGVLFGWGTLLFTGLLARRLYGRQTGDASLLVLATSYGFLAVTHHMESDAGLIFFGTGAAYFLWCAIEGPPLWYGAAALAALGAFFSKGFIGLVFPALLLFAWIAWSRSPRELLRARPWIWVPLMAVPIGLWLLALHDAPQGGLLNDFLYENHLQRFLGARGDADRGHQKPIWYYLIQLPLWFLPWTLVLAAGVRRIWLRRSERPERFLLSWVGTGFLFLSVAGSKRAVYLAPLLPPLAILAASWLETTPKRRWLEPAAVALSAALAISWFSVAPGYDERHSYRPFCRELAAVLPSSGRLYGYDLDEVASAAIPFYTGRRFEALASEERVAELAGGTGSTPATFVITVDVRGKDWHSREVCQRFPHLWLAMPEKRDHRMLVYSNVPRP